MASFDEPLELLPSRNPRRAAGARDRRTSPPAAVDPPTVVAPAAPVATPAVPQRIVVIASLDLSAPSAAASGTAGIAKKFVIAVNIGSSDGRLDLIAEGVDLSSSCLGIDFFLASLLVYAARGKEVLACFGFRGVLDCLGHASEASLARPPSGCSSPARLIC